MVARWGPEVKSPPRTPLVKTKGVIKPAGKAATLESDKFRQRKPSVQRSLKQAFDAAKVHDGSFRPLLGQWPHSCIKKPAWRQQSLSGSKPCARQLSPGAGPGAGHDVNQLAQSLTRSLHLQHQQLDHTMRPQQHSDMDMSSPAMTTRCTSYFA